MDKIARLKEILESSHRAVFFGGAGMSTESGIPDFRSAGGIYSETLHREFRPEQMASHSFLMAHLAEFFDFYRRRFVYLERRGQGLQKARDRAQGHLYGCQRTHPCTHSAL